MPTIQDIMQTIADYLEEHDKEDVADLNRRRSELHPDVRPHAMMARTCYLEFDPVNPRAKLPGCFTRSFGHFIGGYVILQDPNRNQIQVSIERKNTKLYFAQGWSGLKDFYNIQVGGWLTILYISPTIFHIRVRRITGNEVDYPKETPPHRILLTPPCGEGPSNGSVRFYAVPTIFFHKLEKTLSSSDVQSGALTLFWKGFCESALPNKDCRLTLVDWLGHSWECNLQVGSNPHITCQISRQWGDICKARRLTAGLVVKFGVTSPSNNRVVYFKVAPFIGVRTTLIGPTRDAKRKPFYKTEQYFML